MIEDKSLINQHTEEMISKDYFQQWLHLKMKINVSLIFLYFCLQIVNLIAFILFDIMFIWIEHDLKENTADVCNFSNRTLSCVQNKYTLGMECSFSIAYICLVLTLFMNIYNMFMDIRDIHVLVKNFKPIFHTPLGKRRFFGSHTFL